MKCLRAVLFLFFVLVSTCLGAWESIGPYCANIQALAVYPPNENIVYAITYSNPSLLFKSTNGGDAWTKTSTIPEYSYALAVDPNNSQAVWLGCNNCVYRSTDGGTTWRTAPVPGYYVYGLAVNRTSPNIIYGAGRILGSSYYSMAFFKSTDTGATWDSTILEDREGWAYCLEIDPVNPSIVYVGGFVTYNFVYYPKVYRSSDGGNTFADCSSGIPGSDYNYVTVITVARSDPSLVFAATYAGGIYRSTNGGVSWTQCAPYDFTGAMSTTTLDPNLVYAGADTCIYISSNRGLTWNASNNGLFGKNCRGLYASQSTSATVYAGNNIGFSRSSDGGSSWASSNTGMNIANIASFGNALSSSSTIYTAVVGISMYRTTNNGQAWQVIPMPVTCGSICATTVSRTSPNTVYCFEGAG